MKENIKAKKKFGQNFLKNEATVERIINCVGDFDNSLVVEVGPGTGAMTEKLAVVATNVLAYEIDDDLKTVLCNRLKEFNNINVVFKDFLNSNLCSDISLYSYNKLYFVSNVPYYITTPIIMKILKSNVHFNNIVLMVQKEVGDRLSSSPGCKNYGAISVILQYFYDIREEFDVLRGEFFPVPNVDSVIISLKEKNNKLFLKDYSFFEKLVYDCFRFKRKNLKNNLKGYDNDIAIKVLNSFGFDLNSRAEQLPLEVFCELSNSLC